MENLTAWEYSERTEAERLLHCAHQIATGFYKANNFIVLPFVPKQNSVNLVTFPDLPYNKISRFWEKAKKYDVYDMPLPTDLEFTEEIMSLIKSNIIKPKYESVQKLWSTVEKLIISEVYNILPEKRNLIKKITIYPTCFGTSSSFNFINKNGEIIIYLRDDQGIHTITEAIITSLTREDIYKKLEGLWQESEIITDFLITQTSIGNLLQKYEEPNTYIPTLKGVRIKQHARLIEESDNFYKKLGLPTNQKIFGLNGKNPEVYKKPLENLSATEKTILKLLIEKAGGVVTFDEFGNELFKEDGDFSLYAISKNIERLRNKLEENGISGSYIQTLRGKGYVLKN